MATRGPYLLIALPLALAACGGSSARPKNVSIAPIDAGVTHTLAQGSEQIALSGEVDLSGAATALSGSGAFKRTAGELHLTISEPLIGDVSLDVREQGTSAWIMTPLLTGSLHGKRWLLIDLGKAPAKLFGIDVAPLLIGASPASLLDHLEQGSNPVDLGSESVSGVSTTHYRVEVSTTNVNGLEDTEDAWIDGQNLVRKLSYSVPIAGNGTSTKPAVLTMTLTGFGTPVTIAPPPPADVVFSGMVGG